MSISIITFNDFITEQRSAAKPPNADIRSRWTSRIVARGLHQQGAAGVDAYLRDYGKGISASKVIALALMAEAEDCPDMAQGFWAKAFHLTTGAEPETTDNSVAQVTSHAQLSHVTAAASGIPAHLQPGSVITMQPVDAAHDRQHYINNSSHIGQPKRDGNRIVVIATADKVWYQARSTNLIASPGRDFDSALKATARTRGTFILDGEKVFLDVAGVEHRTGSQAAQANAELGQPQVQVRCIISVFKALFAKGCDLTTSDEVARISAGQAIVEHIIAQLQGCADQDVGIEMVPTAWNAPQKKALCDRQRVEGREGEVWILADTVYLGGKTGGEAIVRTKYLTETEVIITGLTPTTVAGRPFGAIEVAEAKPDGAGRSVGRVGTGFDGNDAKEIAALVARHPEGLRILVRHQGRTETGMLWHARFVRIIGPVGMVA